MAIKPSGGFARISSDAHGQESKSVLQRRYGTVQSIGDGTVDVLPDDLSGLKRKLALRGGIPAVGDRVEIQDIDGQITAQAVATAQPSARGAGQVILAGPSIGGGGSSFPLVHAFTHAAGGSDPLTPAAIGAATSSDITAAINTHLAAGDPHTMYLLASGARNMGGTLNVQHLIPELANTYDLGSLSLPWRRIYASEFDTSTLVAGAVQSIGGKVIVAKDTGVLPGQIVAADSTINFGATMTPNDFLLFQGLGQLEYMQVGALVSGTTYNVTRNLDGSGANDWPSGAVWVDLGYNGDGYITLDAGTGAPIITLNLAGTAYNGYTTPVQIDANGLAILTKSVEYTAGKIKFSTAAGVSVLDISTKEISAYEEDAYITAGSNFTGTDKSGYLALMAKGKDTAGNNTSAAVQIAGGTNPLAWPAVRMVVVDVASAKAGTSNFYLYGNSASLDVPFALSDNLIFTGTGKRITGDFSNATQSNRLLFQTNAVNASTNVGVIPNGTGNSAYITVFGSSDPTNSSIGNLIVDTAAVAVNSTVSGTGTQLPLAFRIGAVEKARLRTDGIFYSNGIACRVYNSAAISIPNNAWTALAFDTERYDTDTMHSISVNTSRITFTTAGIYHIGGNVEWAAFGSAADLGIAIRINGTTYIAKDIYEPGTATIAKNINAPWNAAAGNYAELMVYQNVGAAHNINATSAYSPEFWAEKVG